MIYFMGNGVNNTAEYELIRSNRKTASIEVTSDGRTVVRVPRRMPAADIDFFVASHREWIEKARKKQLERADKHPEPSEEEKRSLIEKAKLELPELVEYYSASMGVKPEAISVTGARKRFGSCSGKNRICFSWRLMSYPRPAIEYVVVHELAHIRHKDHSRDFYAFVESILPDYKEREKLLRQ